MPGSGNISTTIQTPEGGVVLITVYRSGRLFEVVDDWINNGVRSILCVSSEWVCNTYRGFY